MDIVNMEISLENVPHDEVNDDSSPISVVFKSLFPFRK
jgi:hypothetical protein